MMGQPPVLGMVSHADLTLGTAVKDVLEAMQSQQGGCFAVSVMPPLTIPIRQRLIATPAYC